MFQLNTSQACELYKVLKNTVFQIRVCSENLDNRGVRSLLLLSILNYEILNIC
jgi:hypothetical protein